MKPWSLIGFEHTLSAAHVIGLHPCSNNRPTGQMEALWSDYDCYYLYHLEAYLLAQKMMGIMPIIQSYIPTLGFQNTDKLYGPRSLMIVL